VIQLKKEDRFTIITPQMNSLDSHVAAEFRTQFSELLNRDPDFILLDLSRVTFMDSSGLAAIAFCFQMTDIKEKLAICAVTERVGKLFKLTQMETLLQIYATQQEARVALAGPDQ